MSRATTQAWYDAERVDRVRVVAAYMFLNGVTALTVTALSLLPRWRPPATTSEIVVDLVITTVAGTLSFLSAWLLWNRRKAGAYWVIFGSVVSVLGWLANPTDVIPLIIGLIPITLIAMSWSVLREQDRLSILSKRAAS